MRLFKRRKGLLANRKGNVLVIAAAAMPLLIGSAGLAIDTIQLSLLKRHLQRAADSGALAGAYALVQEKDAPAAVSRALAFNDAFPLASTPIVENGPTVGPYAGSSRAVRVILAAERSLPFWSFFSDSPPTINVEATAALVYTGKYCMVSLDESAGTGITFAGNATVNLGCGVISNTSGANAVSAMGGASVTASPIAAVGGVPGSSVYKQPTLLLPYSLKQKNPFSDILDPALPSTPECEEQITDATLTLTPGKCYKGLNVDRSMTFPAGTYYFTGDFSLNSKANITAHGVTFVFTSQTPSNPSTFPALSIDGSARLDLTAPTSGTYEGIIMHYDSQAPLASHMINGNSSSKFEGAFYFPTQHLTYNGNSDMTTNCIQLVAYRLTFEGNTKINNSCPTGGGAKAFDASWVRLVG